MMKIVWDYWHALSTADTGDLLLLLLVLGQQTVGAVATAYGTVRGALGLARVAAERSARKRAEREARHAKLTAAVVRAELRAAGVNLPVERVGNWVLPVNVDGQGG